jgi:hypothetical protein
MLESRPGHEAAVVLTEGRMARVDAELAREYARVARETSWAG